MLLRYLTFLKIAKDEFSEIIPDTELHVDKLRIFLVDGSYIDVRYPVDDKFSFHWQNL